MALDNANFIAELSITDPPGSDPLSQGDDQIRTIKRATFNSFPLIAAAVNLTDVQLNLAAIKNEINVFTDVNTFNANVNLNAATDTPRQLIWQVAGVNRWRLRQENIAEGNDWLLQRLDGTGSLLDAPWRVSAATGIIDFAQVPTVQGAPLWIAGELRMFVAAATPGTNWFIADGTNGTVNLDNRVLTGEGLSSPGALLAPNLVGTAAAGTTGSTVLTEAQMPNHRHTALGSVTGAIDTLLRSSSQAFGGITGAGGISLADQVGNGTSQLIGNTGSSASHNHTSPAQTVTENGADRNTVRPLSAVVQYHQYVP